MTDTEIILVRHGQANTGATNERDYDRLSPLGHQQANWLGDHFRNIGLTFDHVISGTLRRHKETTDGLMLTNDVEYDARVNEMLYFDMAHEFKRTNGVELPSCATTFAHHVPQVFDAW
ncbi:MAG: phosphoglycerate mutase family protein, partial [Planktomarina sp.]